VYVRFGFGWLAHGLEGKLTASDGAASDRFGTSVALTGYTVIVGAPQDDVVTPQGPTGWNQGSAYQFICNGTCSETARMSAAGYLPSARVGQAVAIDVQTAGSILVGAPYPGAAYVFR
jgi:hypothetical protein